MLVYGKEPWICRAMLVYGRVNPTHEVIPPFTLNFRVSQLVRPSNLAPAAVLRGLQKLQSFCERLRDFCKAISWTKDCCEGLSVCPSISWGPSIYGCAMRHCFTRDKYENCDKPADIVCRVPCTVEWCLECSVRRAGRLSETETRTAPGHFPNKLLSTFQFFQPLPNANMNYIIIWYTDHTVNN